MNWLKRLRTSYGFGVHSPFAFSLITDTLRLRGPYAYYAYADLPSSTDRLIYRLKARLGVSLYIADAPGSIPTLPSPLPSGDAVLILHPTPEDIARWQALRDERGYGMTFTACRSLFADSDNPEPYFLLCLLPHLPKADFLLYT